jgi:hypothetical protein
MRAVRAELRGLYPIVANHVWDYVIPVCSIARRATEVNQ